jgi:hypothetical protein
MDDVENVAGEMVVEEAGLRRSNRLRRQKVCGCCHIAKEVEINEPKSVTEALTGTHSENWLLAMKEELNTSEENETWGLVK